MSNIWQWPVATRWSQVKILVLLTVLLCVVATIIRAIYNIFFHPLSRYPGRWSWSAFQFPVLFCMMNGRLPYVVHEMHQRWGPVVRIAPNELSFVDPAAWKDIYGRADTDRPIEWKPHVHFSSVDNIVTANPEAHARIRKAFGPGFSERAIRSYEDNVQSHVTKMFHKFRDMIGSSSNRETPAYVLIDLVRWFNFCLYDAMMDIGWGVSFNLLDTCKYNPWVANCMRLRELLFDTCLKHYQPLATFAKYAMMKFVRETQDLIVGTAARNVDKRLEFETDRQDMFHYILGQEKDNLTNFTLNKEELQQTSMVLVLAGSEPVSTALCGVLNHLLRTPDTLSRLTTEIRSTFQDSHSLNDQTLRTLPYLDSVIKEGLRIAPPFPDGMRREITAREGALVAGQYVHRGTVVSVPCWGMFRCSSNFSRPDEFIPERFLQKPLYTGGQCQDDFSAHDLRAFHPFSYGSRDCIGKHLAKMELRIILARLLQEFDISLNPEHKLSNWEEQDVYWTVQKSSMIVRISPRQDHQG